MDKLFDKYSLENLEIKDKSIAQVISLKAVSVPHTFGRNSKKNLGKTNVNVVERLANKLMRGGTGEKTSGKVIRTHGRMQGKKLRALNIVKEAFAKVLDNIKKQSTGFEAPAEEAYRIAFMLEDAHYLAEAHEYYTKAATLDSTNVLYRSTLMSFRKDYEIK